MNDYEIKTHFFILFESTASFGATANFPVRWEGKWIDFQNTFPKVKGIPANLKNIKKGVIWFDPEQFIYQNYVAGKLSKEDFIKIKKRGDLEFYSKNLVKAMIKCYVTLIEATNEKNDTVYLLDANNNDDFSDDRELKPPDINVPEKELNIHLINTVCQRIVNGKIINDKVPILLVKRGPDLLYSIAQYATVSVNVDRNNYGLAVCSQYFYSRSWKETNIVLLTNNLKTEKAKDDMIVHNKGFIKIDKYIYKFIGVDITKNKLFLQKMSSDNQYSPQVGFQAPLFTIHSLKGQDFSLASLNKKYILIDFWGTWCKPCRAQLPDLVWLNNSSDTSRFSMLSVASLDNLDSLKKVVSAENMNWPQMLSDKIAAQYQVNAFPTSFLINPGGIIIAKNPSITELKERLRKLSILPYD